MRVSYAAVFWSQWLLLDPNSFRNLLRQTGQIVIKDSRMWKGHKQEKRDWNVVPSDSYPLHSSQVWNWVLAPAKTAFPLRLLNTATGHQGRDRAFLHQWWIWEDNWAAVSSELNSMTCGCAGLFQGYSSASPGFWKELDLDMQRHSAQTKQLSPWTCVVANLAIQVCFLLKLWYL